jgi:hypothetical protein
LLTKILLRAARFNRKNLFYNQLAVLVQIILLPARFARKNLTTGGAKKAYYSETLTARFKNF